MFRGVIFLLLVQLVAANHSSYQCAMTDAGDKIAAFWRASAGSAAALAAEAPIVVVGGEFLGEDDISLSPLYQILCQVMHTWPMAASTSIQFVFNASGEEDVKRQAQLLAPIVQDFPVVFITDAPARIGVAVVISREGGDGYGWTWLDWMSRGTEIGGVVGVVVGARSLRIAEPVPWKLFEWVDVRQYSPRGGIAGGKDAVFWVADGVVEHGPSECEGTSPKIQVYTPKNVTLMLDEGADVYPVWFVANCSCCNIREGGNTLRITVMPIGTVNTFKEVSHGVTMRHSEVFPVGNYTFDVAVISPGLEEVAIVSAEFAIVPYRRPLFVSTVLPGIDHVYVCHYAPLADRRQMLEESLDTMGFDLDTHVTFITDFDRKNLTAEIQNRSFDSSMEAWHSRTQWRTQFNAVPGYRETWASEICATMCHVEVQRLIAESGYESALLLEDDAVFSLERELKRNSLNYMIRRVWPLLWKELPSDWDIVMLGLGAGQHAKEWGCIKKDGQEHICRKDYPASRTAGAMLIRKRAASLMQSSMKPFAIVTDMEYDFQFYLHQMAVYWSDPHLLYEGTKRSGFEGELQEAVLFSSVVREFQSGGLEVERE